MDNHRILLEQNLSRFLEWIRAADSKISPIFAVDTSMLAVMAALVPKPVTFNLCDSILLLLAVIPLLISLLFLALAAFPRTKGPVDSLIYFDCIKRKDPDAYLKEVLSVDERGLLLDLAGQCCRNADIASIKYRRLRTAMGALFISVLPWSILVFILYRRP